MAMLLVAVSAVSAASAVEIDSASLLQSRSQTATTQGTVLHSQAYLDAAVARKKQAPVCTAPSTTGYDFNVARGALTIDGFGVTGLSCAAGYTGSATPSVCLSPGAAYSVTGCEPTCNTPTMAGYDFASAGGAVTITGFGPTGLTCAMGYVGLVTASACSLPGIAYSVTGCEPTCKVHGCSAGYVDKGGVESTANPSDEVCCEPACTAPSAAGYNFATSAGVLKMAGFGPTGLTCASGYVGSAMASVCSSPGVAYSLTGCEPTCALYTCPAGLVKRGGVESSTNLSDAACCSTSAISGPFVYHWNEAPLTQPEASHKCTMNGQVLAGIYTREEQLLVDDIQAEAKVWSWIGMDDRNGGRGNFYTSEDVPVVYTNWDRNEPNNLDGEDCVMMGGNRAIGTWNDLSCYRQLHGYFCRLPEDRGRSMGGFSWYSGNHDYEQARSKCAQNGQVLASIYSQAENNDALRAMRLSPIPPPGCVDEPSYCVCLGLDGSPLFYPNFDGKLCFPYCAGLGLDGNSSSCSYWKDAGYCASSENHSFMEENCCATCGFGSWSSSWLGMDDKGRHGRFHTSDRLRLSFTNWAAGEPNNSGNEDCVIMLADGRWNDVRCDMKRPVLCRNVTSDIE